MERKKKLGVIIIGICIILSIVYFVLPSKNKYLIYEGSASHVNDKKRSDDDTLYIGVTQATDSIHPYKQDNETMDILLKLVYEPLIYINEDTSIKYEIAKKVTLKDNGKEAQVKINTDKVFSDKTTLNADLLIKSYQWFMKQDTAYNQLVSNVQNIKKIDNQNVLFTFKEANLENIKVLAMPILYDQNDKSYYGATFLGTGSYQITNLVNHQEMILQRNEESKDKKQYEKIVLRLIDYNNIDSIINTQEIDMFMINKEDHLDKIKESRAYDVYQFDNKKSGYYLVYNMKDKNAVADLVEGDSFFEKTQERGMYSSGIVSAYIDDNYYSLVDSGNFKDIKVLKIRHDIDAVSIGIYQSLLEVLKGKGIECKEVKDSSYEYENFKEDILIYHGDYNQVLSNKDIEEFYKENSQIEIEEFYNQLEKYLSKKNIMSPLSKETKCVAILTTKDTLNFFE